MKKRKTFDFILKLVKKEIKDRAKTWLCDYKTYKSNLIFIFVNETKYLFVFVNSNKRELLVQEQNLLWPKLVPRIETKEFGLLRLAVFEINVSEKAV